MAVTVSENIKLRRLTVVFPIRDITDLFAMLGRLHEAKVYVETIERKRISSGPGGEPDTQSWCLLIADEYADRFLAEVAAVA